MSGPPHGQHTGFLKDETPGEGMASRNSMEDQEESSVQKRAQNEQQQYLADSRKRSRSDYATGPGAPPSFDSDNFMHAPGALSAPNFQQRAQQQQQLHQADAFAWPGNVPDPQHQMIGQSAAEDARLHRQYQAALMASNERMFMLPQANASQSTFGDDDQHGFGCQSLSQQQQHEQQQQLQHHHHQQQLQQHQQQHQHQQLFDSNTDFLQNRAGMPDRRGLQSYSHIPMQQNAVAPMAAAPLIPAMLDSFQLLNNRFQTNQGVSSGLGGNLSDSHPYSVNQMPVSAPAPSSSPLARIPSNFQSGMTGIQPGGLSAADFFRFTGVNTAPTPQHNQSMNPAISQDMASLPSNAGNITAGGVNPNSMLPSLPPIEETPTPHYSRRVCMPFSTDEDQNWLSEFQCFIRTDILELFRVSQHGIKVRNAVKSLSVSQIGIRCRFCAHLQHGTRANRASCFPSKINKIYQSFTMMLREHFPHCQEIPPETKKQFLKLQSLNAQGASNAKGYWEHAAKKMGLVDVSEGSGRGGIHVSQESRTNASRIPPFGSSPDFTEPQSPIPLVYKSDKGLASDFLFSLMEQVYRVHLAPTERKGNRKSLRAGMPGFGCKYCYEVGRMGLCRLFPARRRTIHTKIPDMLDHMKRCSLCPQNIKDRLIYLYSQDSSSTTNAQSQDTANRGREREFFERVWSRLGHEVDSD